MADSEQSGKPMRSASPTCSNRFGGEKRDAQLRPWHVYALFAVVLIVLPLLWFVISYGALPRLWNHHEHKMIGRREQIQSYTAQDIPGDPIGLRVFGSSTAIACAFKRAGWYVADPVNLRSAIRIGTSVILQRPYPTAPVSPLYVKDQKQLLAFERAEGGSADRRHHVRFWQIGKDDWYGAATFDRGVGLSLFTLQVTHHIGPNVDAERDSVGQLLMSNGAQRNGVESSRISPDQHHRNGGGDRYTTDGKIIRYIVPQAAC